MLGYALAHAISRPMVTILITQVLVFVALGYAPINFPAAQMPDWLVDINRALPCRGGERPSRARLGPVVASLGARP